MGHGDPRDVGRLESSPGSPHMQGDIVRKTGRCVSEREARRRWRSHQAEGGVHAGDGSCASLLGGGLWRTHNKVTPLKTPTRISMHLL